MRTLVTATRSLALCAVAAVATQVPVSPAQVLLVVLVGAAVLVPLVARLGGTLGRALASLWHGPAGVWHAPEVPDATAPPAPGTPGTVLARAPSLGALA
jgi:peptidoglycan/LPS O-acetylase OafA/YrhL